MSNADIDALAAELQEFEEAPKPVARSAFDERVITGFEEITSFHSEYGREPANTPGADIFERLLGTRLKAIRRNENLHGLLAEFDAEKLLSGPRHPAKAEELDPDGLAELLGDVAGSSDLTSLQHVRPYAARQAADEVAERKPCPDFHLYEEMFEQVAREIAGGIRKTQRADSKRMVEPGDLYIVGGQTAYIAEMGEIFINRNNYRDARLRIIYDNGTESNLLWRTLQRDLSQDHTSRIILDATVTPLFGGTPTEDDTATGLVYVLRSKSNDPSIARHRDLLHKIGVTTGSVERRIANAKKDPTFLLADVETVATYELYNVNRHHLERLLHRVFAPARADITIKDRFGHPVTPREWFLVPAFIIQEVVERIKDGSITAYVYDPQQVKLVEVSQG